MPGTDKDSAQNHAQRQESHVASARDIIEASPDAYMQTPRGHASSCPDSWSVVPQASAQVRQAVGGACEDAASGGVQVELHTAEMDHALGRSPGSPHDASVGTKRQNIMSLKRHHTPDVDSSVNASQHFHADYEGANHGQDAVDASRAVKRSVSPDITGRAPGPKIDTGSILHDLQGSRAASHALSPALQPPHSVSSGPSRQNTAGAQENRQVPSLGWYEKQGGSPSCVETDGGYVAPSDQIYGHGHS